MRRAFALSILAGVAIGVAAIVLLATTMPPPASRAASWTGEGDWFPCLFVAPVSPDAAVRTALESHGYSADDPRFGGVVAPIYINGTGDEFSVTCRGTILVGEDLGMWHPPVDGRPHFTWRVIIARGFCTNWDLVDWTSGTIVAAMMAC